jgi:hypothetical protein
MKGAVASRSAKSQKKVPAKGLGAPLFMVFLELDRRSWIGRIGSDSGTALPRQIGQIEGQLQIAIV